MLKLKKLVEGLGYSHDSMDIQKSEEEETPGSDLKMEQQDFPILIAGLGVQEAMS